MNRRTLISLSLMLMLGATHTMYGQYASPVKITNTASQAVPATDPSAPGRQAYQLRVAVDPTPTFNGFQSTRSFSIPAGSRFVIEHISVNPVTAAAGTIVWLAVGGTYSYRGATGPAAVTVPFSTMTSGFEKTAVFMASAPVRLILDGGGTITWTGITNTIPTTIQVDLVGYLVDCSAAGSCNN